MKYGKKLVAVLLAVVIAAASMMGCATSAEDTDILLTVGDEEIEFGVVNFYALFFAAYYESYYSSYFGDAMWETEIEDGVTYEDDTKDSIMDTMQELIVVRQHAEELGITLTEEEVAEIEAAAQEFVDANSEEILGEVSGTLEYAIEVLTLFELDDKCLTEVAKGADTEVSDEEAAQMRAVYVYHFLTTTDDDGNSVDMTDEELLALEEELADLQVQAEDSDDFYALAEELGYNVLETTFDSEDTSLNDDLLAALLELSEGEYTGVVKTDSVYYVGQLASEFDEEATEAMKETIIEERGVELYYETIDEWKAEIEIVVNESLWSIVDFEEKQYMMYYETTTEE